MDRRAGLPKAATELGQVNRLQRFCDLEQLLERELRGADGIVSTVFGPYNYGSGCRTRRGGRAAVDRGSDALDIGALRHDERTPVAFAAALDRHCAAVA